MLLYYLGALHAPLVHHRTQQNNITKEMKGMKKFPFFDSTRRTFAAARDGHDGHRSSPVQSRMLPYSRCKRGGSSTNLIARSILRRLNNISFHSALLPLLLLLLLALYYYYYYTSIFYIQNRSPPPPPSVSAVWCI